MNDSDFKRNNKPPACTQAPWKRLIPPEDRERVMREIRQECIDIYGHPMDECPKRKVCWTKQCMGRPLPWDSPTARPYLEELKKTQKIVEGEMIVQDCSGCPIANTCKRPCMQIEDFINKAKVKEPQLHYKESLDNFLADDHRDMLQSDFELLQGKFDVPWDILNERKKQVVHKYLYEQRDFKYVADSLGLSNQAAAKYEFYSALNKLSEYGVMRQFLTNNQSKLSDKQKNILNEVYFNNTSLTNTAKKLNITKQAVSVAIRRVIKIYGIKWHTFVRKSGNKVIYNLVEVIN